MSWNGAGTYSLPAAYFPEAAGNLVDSARYNGVLSDLSTGLNVALTKNGQNAATANLPMGGFKHTGAAIAASAGEYLVYGQTGANLASLDVTSTLNTGNVLPITNLVGSLGTSAKNYTSVFATDYLSKGILVARLLDSFASNATYVTNVVVPTTGGNTAGLILLGGPKDPTGVAWSKLYLLAVRASGGAAPDVAATLVASAGDTGPTAAFAVSGGVLRITVSGNASGVVFAEAYGL